LKCPHATHGAVMAFVRLKAPHVSSATAGRVIVQAPLDAARRLEMLRVHLKELGDTGCCSNFTAPAEGKPLTQFAENSLGNHFVTLNAGKQSNVPVTVKNSGTEAGLAKGTYPVHFVVHAV
jgi:hypothetical protein